jgi:hypothetical protein
MITEKPLKYISIEAVLDDIHSMVDDIDWDEDRMLEWAVKGFRKLNLPAKYEEQVVFLNVVDHTAELPYDLININQIFFRETSEDLTTEEDGVIAQVTGITTDKPFYRLINNREDFFQRILDTNSNFYNYFKPLRRYSGHFGFVPCTQDINRVNCEHQYTIESNNFIRTSFRQGCVILSYDARIQENCLDMIPDNENLKDALFHFCMYRFWMSRLHMKEEGTQNLMQFHLRQYSAIGKKAVGEINKPDVDQMENIKNFTQRLVPRANFYDKAFSQLNNRENLTY